MAQILNRWNGNVIAEGEMNLRELVLHVIETARNEGRRADLAHANLAHADLTRSDLTDADLDYCCWPLRCSSLRVKTCDRLSAQLLFHAFAVARINPNPEQIEFIRNFHRFDECGGIDTIIREGV